MYHVCMYVCTYVCMYVRMYVCMYVSIMYVCMYVVSMQFDVNVALKLTVIVLFGCLKMNQLVNKQDVTYYI